MGSAFSSPIVGSALCICTGQIGERVPREQVLPFLPSAEFPYALVEVESPLIELVRLPGAYDRPQYGLPRASTAQAILAFLFATATIARLVPRRSLSFAAH